MSVCNLVIIFLFLFIVDNLRNAKKIAKSIPKSASSKNAINNNALTLTPPLTPSSEIGSTRRKKGK